MFQVVKIDEFKITKINATERGAQISWNVDLNGKPFGQIWTFVPEPGCIYAFNVKTLAGASAQFRTYEQAERFIRGQA